MSRSSERWAVPSYVIDAYKKILETDLLKSRSLTPQSIEQFQTILNESQPTSDEDLVTRTHVQYFYRKNPRNFSKYLTSSRLSHMIMWTESKGIVKHFKLQNFVYVKWTGDSYTCTAHKHSHSSTDKRSRQTKFPTLIGQAVPSLGKKLPTIPENAVLNAHNINFLQVTPSRLPIGEPL